MMNNENEIGVYEDCGKSCLICDVCDDMKSFLEVYEGEECHKCKERLADLDK